MPMQRQKFTDEWTKLWTPKDVTIDQMLVDISDAAGDKGVAVIGSQSCMRFHPQTAAFLQFDTIELFVLRQKGNPSDNSNVVMATSELSDRLQHTFQCRHVCAGDRKHGHHIQCHRQHGVGSPKCSNANRHPRQ